MDLSKAFDCLPHDLLIEKLKAYGVTQESCNIMSSDRLQRVKLEIMSAHYQRSPSGLHFGTHTVQHIYK